MTRTPRIAVVAATLLAVSAPAEAHGDRFSLSTISIAPDDPAAWWGNANGWGVVYTLDAGATWTWRCEESLDTSRVYDILALEGGQAVAATVDGLLRISASCDVEAFDGLPEGAQGTVLERGEDRFYLAVFTDGVGSMYRCDDSGDAPACVATDVSGPYVKSIQAVTGSDGAERVYVTTVETDTLAAALRVSTDGGAFQSVYAWPGGDVDPYLLDAATQGSGADRLLLWALPRSDATVPALLFSGDGGASFMQVLQDGQYTDPVPGLVTFGEDAWLGSDVGRTWRSLDGGRHFSEVSDVEPAVRCGAVSGDTLLVCSDHFADGYDVGVWRGGASWAGAGCLDAAELDTCGEEACSVYYDAFVEAGAYGGGACFVEPEPDSGGCGGCGSGSAAGAAILVAGMGMGGVTRRPRRLVRRVGAGKCDSLVSGGDFA